MESFGLPCDHILSVLVHLNVTELPKCLVLKRWTKAAKDEIQNCSSDVSSFWDSHKRARYLSLMEYYSVLSACASESWEDYDEQRKRGFYLRKMIYKQV